MNDIRTTFNIPEEFPLGLIATRLKRAVFYLSEVAACTESERDNYKRMHSELDQRTPHQSAKKRAELHNYLKNYPFMATLLLLDEPHESAYCDDITNRQIALLAHLFDCRGPNDYKAYLAFSKCVIDQPLSILTLACLLDLTSLEIHVLIKKSSQATYEVQFLAPFFAKVRTYETEHKHSMVSAKNRHTHVIDRDSDSDLTAFDLSDEHAEHFDEYLQLESNVALTIVQQRRQFKRRIAGVQRAYYAHESAVAGGMHAALPVELRKFLQHVAPWLLSADMSQLQNIDAPFLLMLFLRLLGLSSPENIVLLNKLSEQQPQHRPHLVYLIYELRRDSGFITANLELRSDMLKTASPQTHDPRVHFSAAAWLSIPVPHPITHLLNAVLRSVPSSKRHLSTLSEAMDVAPAQYVSWINMNLKSCGLHVRGLTKGAIVKAFIQYARESVPETYLRFLSGQFCVQNHYVSVPTAALTHSVLQAWRSFFTSVGMTWKNANAIEAGEVAVSQRFHAEVGSKITLRQEIYHAVYQCLLSESSNKQNCLNQLALYLYLRLASTVGLRPTKAPLPNIEQVNLELGVFTVADKRVHSKEELRLIVMPSQLVKLIKLWRLCARSFAMSVNTSEPQNLLMWWNPGWQSFERTLVNEQLHRITGEPLVNHSLRHTAAQRYIQNSPEFNQQLLDMLLNHSRAGVSVFNQHAISCPAHLISEQQRLLNSVDREFASLDATALQHLMQLSGEKDAAFN
jgi:integrase